MKFVIYVAVVVQIIYRNGYTSVAQQQRVPPGVNPQHYQQQQQYQQYQQQQQQFQQQPHVQQVHQVPVQQVPVQHVPVQQAPVQQQVPVQQPHHGHHVGSGRPSQILDPSHIAEEKEHIAEHIEVPIDTSKMTEQELQFHYFKMHDADNNNKLDGCELIKSLIHWHDPKAKDSVAVITEEQMVTVIDPVLEKADKDNDGYIDYGEFKTMY